MYLLNSGPDEIYHFDSNEDYGSSKIGKQTITNPTVVLFINTIKTIWFQFLISTKLSNNRTHV